MTENVKNKRCRKCGTLKPLSDFGNDVTRPDGLNTDCRECRRQRYQELHGGLEHALRKFTDDELIGEMIRRKAAYDLLDCIPSEDIASYLRELGYSVEGRPAKQSQTEKGGEA